jgi:hypothetical protein
MRVWLLVTGLVASGALGLLIRRLRRGRHPDMETVTKEWLAETASREDPSW